MVGEGPAVVLWWWVRRWVVVGWCGRVDLENEGRKRGFGEKGKNGKMGVFGWPEVSGMVGERPEESFGGGGGGGWWWVAWVWVVGRRRTEEGLGSAVRLVGKMREEGKK
jgi:hypothetical protein